MDELAGDATAHDIVARHRTADLGGGDGDDGAQPLAAGDDEMRGDLREVRIGRLHGGVDLPLDAFEIPVR